MNQLAPLPHASVLADDAEHIAEERIFSDLINTLLAERFLDDQLVDWLAPEVLGLLLSLPDGPFWEWSEETRCLRWWVDRDAKQAVVFPVRKAIVQPYRYVPSGGVFSVRFLASGDIAEQWRRLTPVELMEQVVAACLDEPQRQQKGVANVLDLLATTRWQLRQSITGSTAERNLLNVSTAQCFQALERRAALRDRPFHPVAKAKQGLDEANHERYAAEFDRPMSMRWIAMDRRQLMLGTEAASGEMLHEPLDLILTAAERQALEAEMASRGLARSTHLAMPVHPWQMAYGLPEQLSEMLAQGDGIPLETVGGVFQATSSLRSLAPVGSGRHYLKLPMAVFSLGAARYLPAVKLINGERGQTMLEQAKPLDPVLQTRLYLCHERQWWSYMPEGSGLFDDPPRHLGVMVREYPASLLEDQHVRLLPMAALGVPLSRDDGHFFDDWLRYRRLPAQADAIEGLFAEDRAPFLAMLGHELRELLKKELPSELSHAMFLADKIVALGGEVMIQPTMPKTITAARDLLQANLNLARLRGLAATLPGSAGEGNEPQLVNPPQDAKPEDLALALAAMRAQADNEGAKLSDLDQQIADLLERVQRLPAMLGVPIDRLVLASLVRGRAAASGAPRWATRTRAPECWACARIAGATPRGCGGATLSCTASRTSGRSIASSVAVATGAACRSRRSRYDARCHREPHRSVRPRAIRRHTRRREVYADGSAVRAGLHRLGGCRRAAGVSRRHVQRGGHRRGVVVGGLPDLERHRRHRASPASAGHAR